MIKDIYREEKNKDVYTDVENGEQGSYTNDYVKWLENLAEKQVKNIAYISNQRELFNGFWKYLDNISQDDYEAKDERQHVDDYLKTI